MCLSVQVCGRREPSELNMMNLIKGVNLLQGNFVYCSPSLVPGTDIKFAFELARSVISSQLTKLAGSSRKDVKVACSICFEDTNAQLMFTVDGCQHQYCFFCMKHHVEVKLSHRDLPKCPYVGCTSAISVGSCQKLLYPKLLEITSHLVKKTTIPAPEKVYCPNPSCSTLMHRHEVKEYSSTPLVKQRERGASKCTKCQGLLCIDCKTAWHYNMTCSEYQRHQSSLGNPDKS